MTLPLQCGTYEYSMCSKKQKTFWNYIKGFSVKKISKYYDKIYRQCQKIFQSKLEETEGNKLDVDCE